jgi:hypothetical protein
MDLANGSMVQELRLGVSGYKVVRTGTDEERWGAIWMSDRF